MKIKPINENIVCGEVRYNDNTCGTHLYIASGTENKDKRDYGNLTLLSMMYECGFIKKQQGKTAKEIIEEAALLSSSIVEEADIQSNVRL